MFGDIAADFSSQFEKLVSVAVVGCDIDAMVGYFSREYLKLVPGLTGLVNTGVRALRNSVYASGGVIGVEAKSSCLMLLTADSEALLISDGKVQLLEVCIGCRTGLVAAPGAMIPKMRRRTKV